MILVHNLLRRLLAIFQVFVLVALRKIFRVRRNFLNVVDKIKFLTPNGYESKNLEEMVINPL